MWFDCRRLAWVLEGSEKQTTLKRKIDGAEFYSCFGYNVCFNTGDYLVRGVTDLK